VEGNYVMDYEDLREKIDDRTRMIIFCSPHNPVSRVWKKGELEQLVEVCEEKDIIIVSDEIHCDLILGKTRHTPVACVSEEAMQRTVTLIAPSKTFNLAGLNNANAIIPNKKLRDSFRSVISKNAAHNHIFGIIAQEAAYNAGEQWLEGLMDYLQQNLDLLTDYISHNYCRSPCFLRNHFRSPCFSRTRHANQSYHDLILSPILIVVIFHNKALQTSKNK